MNTSLTGRVEVARCTHLSLSIDVPVEKRRREREWRLVAAAAIVDRSAVEQSAFMAINCTPVIMSHNNLRSMQVNRHSLLQAATSARLQPITGCN